MKWKRNERSKMEELEAENKRLNHIIVEKVVPALKDCNAMLARAADMMDEMEQYMRNRGRR